MIATPWCSMRSVCGPLRAMARGHGFDRPPELGARGHNGTMLDCPPIPAFIRRCTQADLITQNVIWSSATGPWPEVFRDHSDLRGALEAEIRAHGHVRRECVFGYADGDPLELFLAAMAWVSEPQECGQLSAGC